MPLPDLNDLNIPGHLQFRIGSAADYRRLARFHYTQSAPASFRLTACIDHVTAPANRRLIAVAVLSNPALNCALRQRILNLGHLPPHLRWTYLNRHLRTISRVIVHPQFRGIGLSTRVIRFLLRQSPTRYVEALSRLAAHHPLFTRAGMTCLDPGHPPHPAYYLYDALDLARASTP